MGLTQSALPGGLLKSGTLLEHTDGEYLCYEELEARGEKTQNETYCVAGDGGEGGASCGCVGSRYIV